MYIKHIHFEGHSRAFLVKFEAAEDIINSISTDRGQYHDYLQTTYNYVEKLKISIIMHGIVTKILFHNSAKLSNSTNQ